ncbi:hypothetical protein AVEN_105139-1 [Araneus ventricosus]|uniref:Uncharacterized protein n=1 Tax=Araneus ventricosus TaxID=182803 RepID=A0A4Y2V1M1_ARAVE|nr:hypothetical protein AVEN_105139-1 [Araneus ventricosus]
MPLLPPFVSGICCCFNDGLNSGGHRELSVQQLSTGTFVVMASGTETWGGVLSNNFRRFKYFTQQRSGVPYVTKRQSLNEMRST